MRWSVLSLLALAACADTVLPVTHGPVTTAEDFRATAVGKTISNSTTSVRINKNGTLTGITNGTEIAGTWEFRDGAWCRTITSPAPSAEDCQLWRVDGSTVTIKRDRGKGSTLRFVVTQPAIAENS